MMVNVRRAVARRYLTCGVHTFDLWAVLAWRLEAVGESGAETVTRVWLDGMPNPLTLEGDHHTKILEAVETISGVHE